MNARDDYRWPHAKHDARHYNRLARQHAEERRQAGGRIVFVPTPARRPLTAFGVPLTLRNVVVAVGGALGLAGCAAMAYVILVGLMLL